MTNRIAAFLLKIFESNAFLKIFVIFFFSDATFCSFFTLIKLEDYFWKFREMKNLIRNLHIHYLALTLLAGVTGCNLYSIKAEETGAKKNKSKVEAKFEEETAPKMDSPENAQSTITAESVVGNYDYDTFKNNEGYDNSLEIKHAGGDKIYVSLSGTYIYQVGETQSFHEAEGKGDAVLRGNSATATLVDESGKPCRATLTFKPNETTVKVANTCTFNVALDGVYKRVSAQSKETREKPAANIREISYSELQDFINDFDNHKPGERFIINDVPVNTIEKPSRADQFGNTSYKNLFYLETSSDDGSTTNSFLTSKAMIQSIENEVEFEPASLRVTAILIESNGKFDVYRLPFAVKIEGLHDDGKVTWTATGGEPAKVKFQH